MSAFLLRIPVPWVFVLSYLVGLGLEVLVFPGGSLSRARFVTEAGIVLFVMGVVFAGWGWVLFWRARTTRIPGQASTTLVTWGPYRVTRNPMYVGMSIAYLGEAAILQQPLPVLLLPFTIAYVNWVVIPVEERRLREVFGAAYEEYQRRVGRWF